ncbi:MAG: 50S ribosomal protein L24, partial [Candidatus Kapaibacteriota bacterium]
MKLKKGDLVQVIAGNDKGAIGRILEIYPEKMQVLVEGVNVRKKHSRPTQQNPKGGIISKEMPIHYSNVMILDSDKNPTRIGIRTEEKDG